MRYSADALDLPEDLLTYRQAWELLGISRTGLARMIEAGEVERVYIGKSPRILRPSVTEYLRRQLAARPQ
jgi:excisionase family DNA binding protein